jgi:DNA polymerase-3 subunit gamma/tau
MPRPSTLPRPERKTDEASSRGNFDAPTSPFAPSLGGPVGASGTAGTSGGVGEGVGVGVSRLDHGHESSTPKPATPADPRVDVRDVRDVGDVDPAALAPPIPPESLEAWRAILGRLAEKKAFLASVFERAVPTSVSREKLVLGFHPESFEASQASDPEALDTLRREAIAHFGGTPEVALDLSTRHRGDRGTVAALDAQKRREEIAAARAAVAQHPMVQQAITLFGAELKEIKLPGVRDD